MNEKIFLNPNIGYVIDEITSHDISTSMLKPHPISLNETSYQSVIKILHIIRDRCIDMNIVIDNIYIDTVGDPEYYKHQLIQGLGQDYGIP